MWKYNYTDELRHSAWQYTNRNELYHHGIKGMKWGVRRYQNSDGSLTSAGKQRYGSKEKQTSSGDTNNRDHSKSNKSELALMAASIVRDVLTLNPITTAADVVRLAQAGASFVKVKKFNKEREQCPTDKKTGFLLKNKEMSSEEDVERVNPSVHNFDSNTKNNCMLCTVAYDLRRRGYEVQAKKASYGYAVDELKAWYPKVKIETIVGVNSKESHKVNMDKLKSKILSQGEGARGNLMITWKNSFGGHSVAYEVKNGKFRIIDAQVNKIYDDPDKFLKRCASSLDFARLDNVPFNMKTIKEVAY